MKKLFYQIVVCLLAGSVNAQTFVSDTLTGNNSWDASGNPYILTNNIFIPQGSTLYIHPGVEVKFNGTYSFVVSGTLRAIGSADSLITFRTGTFIPSHIGGFVFGDSATSYDFINGTGCMLQYCDIESSVGVGFSLGGGCGTNGGIVFSRHATPLVDNCIFKNNYTLIWIGCDLEEDLYFTNNKIFNTASNGSGSYFILQFNNPSKKALISCNVFKDAEIGSWNMPMDILNGKVDFVHNIFDHAYIYGHGLLGFGGNIRYNQFLNVYFKDPISGNADSVEYNTYADFTPQFGGGGGMYFLRIVDSLGVVMHNNFINIPLDSNSNSPFDRNYYMWTTVLRQHYMSPHINCTQNYWGTTDTSFINNAIIDYYDDTAVHHVDYLPILSSPEINAPVSPVHNLIRTNSGGNVLLQWDPNPESDIAGYRIYWGGYTGYSYTNQIDAGNVTSYNINGVSPTDSVAVTAYDINSTSFNDFCSGQECWFSSPRLTLTLGINEISAAAALNFFPNPFTTFTQARLPDAMAQKNLILNLTDEPGRKVKVQPVQSKYVTIMRDGLKPGIYFYNISDATNKTVARGKLVVGQ